MCWPTIRFPEIVIGAAHYIKQDVLAWLICFDINKDMFEMVQYKGFNREAHVLTSLDLRLSIYETEIGLVWADGAYLQQYNQCMWEKHFL